jgi:hypothetical protein
MHDSKQPTKALSTAEGINGIITYSLQIQNENLTNTCQHEASASVIQVSFGLFSKTAFYVYFHVTSCAICNFMRFHVQSAQLCTNHLK